MSAASDSAYPTRHISSCDALLSAFKCCRYEARAGALDISSLLIKLVVFRMDSFVNLSTVVFESDLVEESMVDYPECSRHPWIVLLTSLRTWKISRPDRPQYNTIFTNDSVTTSRVWIRCAGQRTLTSGGPPGKTDRQTVTGRLTGPQMY